MYFVRNFFNKFTRKDRKDTVDFTKWWDSKHVMTQEEKCKVRGHIWKPSKDGTQAICETCKKVQTLRWDGNEGP